MSISHASLNRRNIPSTDKENIINKIENLLLQDNTIEELNNIRNWISAQVAYLDSTTIVKYNEKLDKRIKLLNQKNNERIKEIVDFESSIKSNIIEVLSTVESNHNYIKENDTCSHCNKGKLKLHKSYISKCVLYCPHCNSIFLDNKKIN